jgi:3-phenylpropionate/cinnamic acid dioxygenase small subunit
MMAYYTLHFSSNLELGNKEQASVIVKVERLMKYYKSHQLATYFDMKFSDLSEE